MASRWRRVVVACVAGGVACSVAATALAQSSAGAPAGAQAGANAGAGGNAGAGAEAGAGVNANANANAGAGAGAEAGAGVTAGAGVGAGAGGAIASDEGTLRQPYSHRMQVSVRLAGAAGYRLAIQYANGDPCDSPARVFCHGVAPVMADAAVGFGVADALEVEARFRVGTQGWNGSLPIGFGLGIRAYGHGSARLKFVFGAAALLDVTAQGTASSWQSLDVHARLEQGIHYDVARQFGFYVQVGETFAVLRAFGLTVDAGLGVQARFP